MGENKKYYTTEEQILQMQEELAHAHDLDLDKHSRYSQKKIMKVVSSLTFIIICCFLLKTWVDVMSAKANGEVPTVLGFQIYEVQTGSMDPTLPVKSLILSKKVDAPEDLSIGDIITFINSEGITVTHRIIDVIDTNGQIGYQTKGDNVQNSIDPEILKPEQVKAVYKMKLPFRMPSSETDGGDGDE